MSAVLTMSDTEKRVETINKFIPTFSYTSIQSAMLVIRYGFNKVMPSWVTWFPTIVFAVVIIIIILILFGLLIFAVVTD